VVWGWTGAPTPKAVFHYPPQYARDNLVQRRLKGRPVPELVEPEVKRGRRECERGDPCWSCRLKKWSETRSWQSTRRGRLLTLRHASVLQRLPCGTRPLCCPHPSSVQ